MKNGPWRPAWLEIVTLPIWLPALLLAATIFYCVHWLLDGMKK